MTPTSVTDQALAGARAMVGGPAAAVLDDVRALIEHVAELLGAPALLRREAGALTVELTAGDVERRLREMPVSVLGEVAGQEVRLDQLATSGFPTVAHVRAAPAWLLQQVPGVGETSAELLNSAAATMAERVRREIQVRLDPDRRPVAHTRLLALLAALRHADEAVSTLRHPIYQLTSGIAPLLADAEPTASRATMLFARPARRTAALSALVRLEAVMADQRVVALRRELDQHAAAIDPGEYRPDELWLAYLGDPTSVNALLSWVVDGAGSGAAGPGAAGAGPGAAGTGAGGAGAAADPTVAGHGGAGADGVAAGFATGRPAETTGTAGPAGGPRAAAARPAAASPGPAAARRPGAAAAIGAAGPAGERKTPGDVVGPQLRQQVGAVALDTSLLTTALRGYQVFGAQYAIHQRRCILGDELGLGKTVQALAVMAHLAAGGHRRFLVICPASVQVNWLNEVARHTRLTALSLHGGDRDKAASRWLRHGGVAVATFAVVGRLRKDVLGADVALLVVDEAHHVGNPEARRSQLVRGAVSAARRVLYLTGAPMDSRADELRNLVRQLQPKLAARLPASGADQALRRAVGPVYLRRTQQEVLAELPDRIDVEDWVRPTDADLAEYVTAVRAGNLMAMRQAAYLAADAAKLERLREIVEEAGAAGMKVVVFSYFLDVLRAARSKLGPAVVGTITAGVPPAARQVLADRFAAADGPAVLLSQFEADGALNVQAASVVVLAEPQWQPGAEDQAVARAHRTGQLRRLQVHRLLAKDTVDERVREIQQHKSLLFTEYASRSAATDARALERRADRAVGRGAGRAIDRSTERSDNRPAVLHDESVPLERRVILAERHRLGIT